MAHAQPQDVTIRQACLEDAPLLSDVATQAYREHYADTWYDSGVWYMQTYLSVSRLQEELQERNARFFLICYNRSPVGFLKLNKDKPLLGAEQQSALELERIYLIKKASGKGIGTYILQWLFEQTRNEGFKIIWLKAMDTSPAAVRFYKKLGFEICGTHEVDFVQKKEGMRGMYIMRKVL